MIHRILAYSLLSIWLLQLADLSGLVELYSLNRHRVKMNNNRMLVKENLHDTFYFESASEVHWIAPGKEFLHQGKLMDVIKMQQQNGSLKITAWSDNQEKDFIHRCLKQKSKSKNTKLKLKKTSPTIPFNPWEQDVERIRDPKNSGLMSYVQHLSDYQPKLLIPPPEALIC